MQEEEEKKRKEEEEKKRKEEEKKEKNKKHYKKISQDQIPKKKVKKIKKPEESSNRGFGFPNYGSYSQSNIFNFTTHYTGNRPILKEEKKECLNCHQLFTLPINEPNKKICPNCVSLLSPNNMNYNNNKNNEPKYDEISPKEYFEKNKDRYYIDNDNNNDKLRNASFETRRLNRPKLDITKCSKCQMNYNPKIHKRFYFCNNCNAYICGNCSKNHYLQFPEHKCSQAINDNNNISQDNINTEINDNNRNKSEPITMCMSCGKEKKEFPNINYIECPTCKKTFCDSCLNKHYRLNQTHLQPLNNNNMNIQNKKEINDEKCKFCGIIHRNAPKRIFYDCSLCKGCICFLCKKTHDLKFYNHKLLNPRRYENTNNNNINNSINNNNNNNNNINYIYRNNDRNNDGIELSKNQKKEEMKRGLYTLFGEVSCFICKREFERFYYCNKCMRLYCMACNINNHNCNH